MATINGKPFNASLSGRGANGLANAIIEEIGKEKQAILILTDKEVGFINMAARHFSAGIKGYMQNALGSGFSCSVDDNANTIFIAKI